MHAVIKTGGKQYRVAEGDLLKVETLPIEIGKKIEFDQVLMVSNGDDVKIGKPMLAGAKVTAEVVIHGRRPKVKILKFKRRKHHMKRQGHRQNFTQVKITSIKG